MILGYPEGFRDTSDIYEAEVLYMTPKKKKIKRKQWIGLVFIAPWLIGLIGLQVYPFVASLFYSFTEYNIMSSPKWIGLANYVKLFTADNEFWYSVKVTLIYTIFTVPGKLTVALIVALVMNKNMKGINFIRTIYYIPSLIGGSIGIASYPKDTDNLEQLIVCADDAMYKVKKNGKNDFAYYEKPTEE
mgnify:CR=1 FL=1